MSFENIFSMRDSEYNRPAGQTYAQVLLSTFPGMRPIRSSTVAPQSEETSALFIDDIEDEDVEPVDVMANIESRAIDALRADTRLRARIESEEGAAWGSIKAFFVNFLPAQLDDRDQLAFRLVKKALVDIYGPEGQGWEQYRHPSRNTSYVRSKL